MDQSITEIIAAVKSLKEIGPYGIVLAMWFISYRDQQRVLRRYEKDMAEQRTMYANNVELVKTVIKIADNQQVLIKDQQDINLLTTRIMTGLVDQIQQNQYCPMLRINKLSGATDAIRP